MTNPYLMETLARTYRHEALAARPPRRTRRRRAGERPGERAAPDGEAATTRGSAPAVPSTAAAA